MKPSSSSLESTKLTLSASSKISSSDFSLFAAEISDGGAGGIAAETSAVLETGDSLSSLGKIIVLLASGLMSSSSTTSSTVTGRTSASTSTGACVGAGDGTAD